MALIEVPRNEKTTARNPELKARDQKTAVSSLLELANKRWFWTPPQAAGVWQRVSGFDGEQIRMGLAELRGKDDLPSERLRSALFFRWGQINPQAAMEAAAEADGAHHDETSYRPYPSIASVARIWLKDDPQAAVAYLNAHPPLLKCGEAVEHIASLLAADGLDTALKRAGEMAPRIQEKMLEMAMTAEAVEEPAARKEFLDRLAACKNPALQMEGWKRLFIRVCTSVDPETAKAGIQNLQLPDEHAGRLWSSVLDEWADDQESKALEWFVKLDGVSGDHRQSKACEDWLRFSDELAVEWLDSQQDQDAATLCRGVAGLIGARFAAGDPTGGWGRNKMAAMERFLNYWHRLDSIAASEWVEKNLPEAAGIRVKPSAESDP